MATICFDVDGVICDDSQDVPYAERLVYPWVKDALMSLKNAGHKIVYHTARYMKRCNGNQQHAIRLGMNELIDWLEKWGLPYDGVFMGKPSADLYVDDKAFLCNSNDGQEDWFDLVVELKNA